MSDNSTTANQDRLFATLSYVVPFFLLVPLIQKQSRYAMFHAVQALTLWVATVVASFAVGLVIMILPIAFVAQVVSLAFMAAALGLIVFGALQAWNGNEKHLPVIGEKGAELFGSVATSN